MYQSLKDQAALFKENTAKLQEAVRNRDQHLMDTLKQIISSSGSSTEFSCEDCDLTDISRQMPHPTKPSKSNNQHQIHYYRLVQIPVHRLQCLSCNDLRILCLSQL